MDLKTGPSFHLNSVPALASMFNNVFNDFARHKDLDFFPENIEAEHAKLLGFVYDNVNNGVYRAGFTTHQRPYEIACRRVFEALDELEERLSKSRYLFRHRIVEADWRLFCTLIRFDAVYHGHFKCNLRRIVDYPLSRAVSALGSLLSRYVADDAYIPHHDAGNMGS